MAIQARIRNPLTLAAALFLAGCAASPQVADWQLNAVQAMQAFQQNYLVGDTAAAEREFVIARGNLARTGREDLLARAEVVRCAVLAAALEFDDCPRFQALRIGARAEEIAYADYLAGKGDHKPGSDALSRLVFSAVQFRTGAATPDTIAQAIELASSQGWRRPLLAWLGVQLKRAEDAGDGETAQRLRRRMGLISG